MKLELSILAGAESKAWLADLTKIVERMEKAVGGKVVPLPGALDTPVTQGDDGYDEDDDFEPKPAAKTKSKLVFEDFKDISIDDATDEELEDDEETVAVKKTLAKKATTSFDDDDFDAPTPYAKKATKKAAASFDEMDDEETEEKPVQKAKTKKYKLEDVNAACLLRAAPLKPKGPSRRDEVLALLVKHFKVRTVQKLTPDQYEAAIKVLSSK